MGTGFQEVPVGQVKTACEGIWAQKELCSGNTKEKNKEIQHLHEIHANTLFLFFYCFCNLVSKEKRSRVGSLENCIWNQRVGTWDIP